MDRHQLRSVAGEWSFRRRLQFGGLAVRHHNEDTRFAIGDFFTRAPSVQSMSHTGGETGLVVFGLFMFARYRDEIP